MSLRRLVLILFVASTCVLASPIPGLNNTGVDTTGNIDNAWTINGGTAFVTAPAAVTGFPFGAWFANTGASQWLSPQSSYPGTVSDPVTSFNFVTHFDLTGLDPATASILVRWAVDNEIADILLNGTSIGHTFAGATFFGFSTDEVTISSGFQAGDNTLQFVINNTVSAPPNPAGLRVEFESDASEGGIVTPEPASLVSIGTALLGLGAIWRRNKRKSA